MPYPKVKSENYTNFGGINNKVSTYLVGKNECLDLVNFDFTKTGSLTRFPGSTQYLTYHGASPIWGLNEFFVSPYTTLNPEVFASTAITTTGYSYLIFSDPSGVYGSNATGTSQIYTYPTLIYKPFKDKGLFDFQAFQNRLYACSGTNFFKFDGQSAYAYGVAKPQDVVTGMAGSGSGTLTGLITTYFSYKNQYGLLSPALSATLSLAPGGFATCILQMATGYGIGFSIQPTWFGISSIIVWIGYQDNPIVSLGEFPAGFATYALSAAGLSAASGTTQPPSYVGPLDQLKTIDPAFSTAGSTQISNNPKYIELFNNALFFGGMALDPSTVKYSDVGEPEIIQVENFIDIRTQNSDSITGMKTFSSELLIGKNKSVHAIKEDGVGYYIVEKTLEYGFISNRAVVVWEDVCWFLDEKGICEYNGANFKIVSDKVEETFLRMNVPAAMEQAIMVHVKDRNEIWCAFPIDDSTTNNVIVFFDYSAGAWGKREGINASALITAFGRFPRQEPFYGSYSGIICNVEEGLLSDNGVGMTFKMKTYANSDMGNSTEKMYRRLFLDADYTGVTMPVQVNFYKNHEEAIGLTRTMYMGTTFQDRIDFGLPAKDLSVEFVYSGVEILRINGYTIESRFQRAV